jgi:hypothetical protein
MKNIIYLVIAVFFTFSCIKQQKYSLDQFYGEYNPIKSEMHFSLFYPNKYGIIKYNNIYKSDLFTFTTIEEGFFNIVGDTIFLISKNKQKSKIYIFNIDMIKVVLSDNFIPNDTLYCCDKKDKNNQSIYGGRWKNGKKEGRWYYNYKKFQDRVLYKDGEIMKRDTVFY